MPTNRQPVLLIDRGCLASLTALLIEPHPARVVPWWWPEDDAAAPQRRAVVEEHARRFGSAAVVALPPRQPFVGPDHARDAFQATASKAADLAVASMLVEAAVAAHRLRCSRVIWPVQVGPEPEAVGRLVQCAAAAAELADLATGAVEPLAIDLPLVDLDDTQVAELAEDAGIPPACFWPCDEAGSEPCVVEESLVPCRSCRRWRTAFEAIGLPWPWQAVPA